MNCFSNPPALRGKRGNTRTVALFQLPKQAINLLLQGCSLVQVTKNPCKSEP